jgi:hypothetical protein
MGPNLYWYAYQVTVLQWIGMWKFVWKEYDATCYSGQMARGTFKLGWQEQPDNKDSSKADPALDHQKAMQNENETSSENQDK